MHSPCLSAVPRVINVERIANRVETGACIFALVGILLGFIKEVEGKIGR